MKDILTLLEKDSRLSVEEIASMLGITADEVAAAIRDYEERKVILGYKTIIDKNKVDDDMMTAIIELHIAPQHGQGFARVAQRISQYDEVESVYLMSGGYDLSVVIRGKTLKEIALFVAQKLAPLKEVTATATHFVLQKFKEQGIVFEENADDQERLILV